MDRCRLTFDLLDFWCWWSSVDWNSSFQRNRSSNSSCCLESGRSQRNSEWWHPDYAKHRHRMESIFPVVVWRRDGTWWPDFSWSCCGPRICMLTELSINLLIPMFFLINVLWCLQGLPAIVGCDKVTQVFRSGDVVILDGSKGTITRVDAS